MTGVMADAALDYAQNGWRVFPCWWRGDVAKAPIPAAVPHGHLDATSDPDLIRAWWRRWPHAMIGAPVPARLLVIDVDPRNGGTIETLGALPDTLTAWSGRGDGGRHLYFLRPAGPIGWATRPVGVDLKKDGYCIVPPSVHPATGDPYRWDQHPPAPLPPHLRALLTPRPPTPRRPRGTRTGNDFLLGCGSKEHLVEWVATATSNVNDHLFWAACRALEDGVLDHLAADLVDAARQAAQNVGTWTAAGERQSWRTVGSARPKPGRIA